MKTIVTISLLLSLTTLSYAHNNPVAFASDSRIKHVTYQDNNVVPINGMAFTTTHIQLGDKETVLDIEGGDSTAWMVTYHPELANVVFVKPTSFNSNTNLTIITNQHAYYFHLMSSSSLNKTKNATYAVKFEYPADKPPVKSQPITSKRTLPKVVNTAYRFSGSPELVPPHVFDDGRFTYFELTPNGIVPAVFAVDDTNGKESTVNTRREGNYLVVQRLAPQFTLRQGKLSASVFNAQEINRIRAHRRPQ